MSVNNVPSKDKLEKALGIGESLSKINLTRHPKEDEQSDEEKRELLAKRQESLKEFQEKQKKIRELDSSDESFMKNSLKDLIELGIETAKLTKEELLMTANLDAANATASLINAVTSTIGQLHDLNHDHAKLDLEKTKVDMKGKKGDGKNPAIAQMSTADMMKLLRSSSKEDKVIDVENIADKS
jgi:hypothetical protein